MGAGEHNRLLSALASVPAADVVPTLARLLAETLGARDVILQLADYQAVVLVRLDSGEQPDSSAVPIHREEPVDDSVAGQAFREQRVVHEQRGDLHLVRAPVTVRGHRLGVLTTVLDHHPDAQHLDEIQTAADSLGIVLTVASQGSDVFEVTRRTGRLSVAAEMQWQLLPGTGLAGSGFELAGHLEPARRVGGDAFDWAHNANMLWVGMHDAGGVADSASLACTLAVSAVRNARRGVLPLAEQASLAGDAVWAQFRGDRIVCSLLLGLDSATGQVLAVDAGFSELLRLRGGQVQPVRLDGQPPLGYDEEIAYTAHAIPVDPEDRLLLFTGGAAAAANSAGDEFGLERLTEAFARTQNESSAETVRLIIRQLSAFVDGELPDDAAIVCLDWHPDG